MLANTEGKVDLKALMAQRETLAALLELCESFAMAAWTHDADDANEYLIIFVHY